MKDEELEKHIASFVNSFEVAFDNDWEFTHTNLQDEYRHLYVSPSGTFISPEVGDEYDNWANRGALLESYRDLVTLLKERGIYAEIGER
jgi:hypothetical protein